jgi:hypothetical protein
MFSDSFDITNMSDQHPVIPVEDNTRIVVMPKNYVIAVEDDNVSQLMTFEVSRYYDGVDLSEMTYIFKYTNANGDPGAALATNVLVEEQTIRLGWLLTNHVAYKEGMVTFLIEFTKNRDSDIYRWQTHPAKFEIEKGLRVRDGDIHAAYPAIFDQILTRLVNTETLVDNIAEAFAGFDYRFNSLSEFVSEKIDTLSSDVDERFTDVNERIDNLTFDISKYLMVSTTQPTEQVDGGLWLDVSGGSIGWGGEGGGETVVLAGNVHIGDTAPTDTDSIWYNTSQN